MGILNEELANKIRKNMTPPNNLLSNRILLFLKGNPKTSAPVIASRIGVPTQSVSSTLTRLYRAGFVTREKIGSGYRYTRIRAEWVYPKKKRRKKKVVLDDPLKEFEQAFRQIKEELDSLRAFKKEVERLIDRNCYSY